MAEEGVTTLETYCCLCARVYTDPVHPIQGGILVNKFQATEVAERLNPSEGEIIFFQSEGQILHPHPHSRNDPLPWHVDAYACRRRFGKIEVAKIHSDDWVTGTEPKWGAWF